MEASPGRFRLNVRVVISTVTELLAGPAAKPRKKRRDGKLSVGGDTNRSGENLFYSCVCRESGEGK